MTTTAYAVPSQTRPGVTYRTTRASCTCLDYTYRQRPCKHMRGLPAHRPVRVVGQAREDGRLCPTCLLPADDCLYGGPCPACGLDQHALRNLARAAWPFDAAMLRCWSGVCGRNR